MTMAHDVPADSVTASLIQCPPSTGPLVEVIVVQTLSSDLGSWAAQEAGVSTQSLIDPDMPSTIMAKASSPVPDVYPSGSQSVLAGFPEPPYRNSILA